MIPPGLLILAIYSCICMAYAASQPEPKNPASQPGAIFAAATQPCRGFARTGASLFYLATSGLSLSGARTPPAKTPAPDPTQDCFYRQAQSPSGLSFAALCSERSYEPERERQPGASADAGCRAEAWLSDSPSPRLGWIWNISLTVSWTPNLPGLISSWHPTRCGRCPTHRRNFMNQPAALYARVSSQRQKENQTICQPNRCPDPIRPDARLPRSAGVAISG